MTKIVLFVLEKGQPYTHQVLTPMCEVSSAEPYLIEGLTLHNQLGICTEKVYSTLPRLFESA